MPESLSPPSKLLGMISVFLLAVTGLQSTRTVTLFRGAEIQPWDGGPKQMLHYWSVEDTSISATEPERNFGGAFGLPGDKNKTILIKFGDLDRVLGPYRKVVKATLFLTPDSAKPPVLRGIYRMLVPWGEGPMVTNSMLAPKPPKPDAPLPAAEWSANWKYRRAGKTPMPWQQSGATGISDAKALNGTLRAAGDSVAIDGLESAVQQMVDQWYLNDGFALTFDAPCLFGSSQSADGRPRLVLEVEKVSPRTGGDLAVTYIERTPEYPKPTGKSSNVKSQDGSPVSLPDPVDTSKKAWPAEEEQLTYRAHIKNVGDAPVQGFDATWSTREQAGSTLEIGKTLAPGEETTVEIQLPFHSIQTDHRLQPISVRIAAKGDSNTSNDCLEVQENALALGLYVEQSVADSVKKNLGLSIEDWIEGQVRFINDVAFQQSRFSFATEGITERVRVQKISIVPDGSLKGSNRTPDGMSNESYDAEWGFTAADNVQSADVDKGFIKGISLQLGLVDLSAMNGIGAKPSDIVPAGSGYADRYPGLMGGGDTRFEGKVSAFFNPPPGPTNDPLFLYAQLEPTDLFAATDAAAFMSALGKRGALRDGILLDLPPSALIKAVSGDGRPLPGVELGFFQLVAGSIQSVPSFTLLTDQAGIAKLPSRDTQEPGPVTLSSGHTLRPNPFGRLDLAGSNGTFVVRLATKGIVELSSLKAWQMVDAVHRGNSIAPTFELRFNVPDAPSDPSVNFAKGRTVTGSKEIDATKLSALTDEDLSTSVELPSTPGSYVEVDLGRDRQISEVLLTTSSPTFWERFDILGYATAQTAETARPWMQEFEWNWTSKNRATVDAKGTTVAYRSFLARYRYIRIVNRSQGSSTSLAEIRILAPKSSTSP